MRVRANTIVFIYQEQIQKTVEILAGYNDSEADEFRKIVAKKIHEKMAKERERFTEKALHKGMTQKEIDGLWMEMESFASYAFNLSHSVSYSVLTVKTAWLKTHFPVEFFAANIIHEMDDINKMMQFILEARRFNINILPPDINQSKSIFTVVSDDTIRFGLSGIMGVGGTSAHFIEERDKNGEFKNITDFIRRCDPKSNVMHNMIKTGCFDAFANRAQLLHQEHEGGPYYIDKLMELVRYYKAKQWVYDTVTTSEYIPMPVVPEFNIIKLIQMEREVTKLWLSEHPFVVYGPDIGAFIKDKKQQLFKYVGFVIDVILFKNKNGLRLVVETHESDIVEFIMFAAEYKTFKDKIGDPETIRGELVKIEAVSGYRNPTDRILKTIDLFNEVDYPLPRNIILPLDTTGLKSLGQLSSLLENKTANFGKDYPQILMKAKNSTVRLIPKQI